VKVSCACGSSVVDPDPQVLWAFLREHRNQAINPVPGVHYKWSAHRIEIDFEERHG
jgi:hypothetical protein